MRRRLGLGHTLQYPVSKYIRRKEIYWYCDFRPTFGTIQLLPFFVNILETLQLYNETETSSFNITKLIACSNLIRQPQMH